MCSPPHCRRLGAPRASREARARAGARMHARRAGRARRAVHQGELGTGALGNRAEHEADVAREPDRFRKSMRMTPELRREAVQPVGKHDRFEWTAVERESKAFAVALRDVVTARDGPRQELVDEPRPPIAFGNRMCGMAKMEKVDERKAARPGSVPIDDADEPSVLGEQIAVEEVTV